MYHAAAILLLGRSALSAPPSVEYRLELLDGPRVSVALRFDGDPDGSTSLELRPSWGGVANDGADVGELTVTDRRGHTIEATRREPHAWSVDHAPGESLRVRYTINRTPERGDAVHGNDYRTRLYPDLFQCIPNLGLLMPAHLDDETNRKFEVAFAGFNAAGWTIASSFGPGEGPFRPWMTASEFLHSMILAGAPGAVRLRERQLDRNTFGVAFVGHDWGFTDDQFLDLAERIVRVERDFFADHSDPWFLVTLTPEGGPSVNGSFSLGGTGLSNCFALFCNTGLSLEPGSPFAPRIALLLAHEYFHTWNGMKIPTAAGEGESYWFSEGFTNFYARRMLHRAGLLTHAQLAEDLSEALAGYDANPFREAPNTRISDEFWKDRSIGQLPYQRGDLVALAIDERIRARTKGRKSLDDFMRDLFKNAAGETEVGTEQLLSMIEDWTDPDFAREIRAAVIEGAPVAVPEAVSEPPLRLTTRSVRTFDPGLDLEQSQAAGAIAGVREGGAAFSAGLRNGQKLRGYSVTQGSPPRATIQVEIDGAPRTIEYEAVSEPHPVRAFEVAQ